MPPPNVFLSTPSARRATPRCSPGGWSAEYFYPRPPRGGRPLRLAIPFSSNKISIHALREEGDQAAGRLDPHPENFYPRPPRRGRRALRGPSTTVCYFYPRPPRGGRPERRAQSAVDQQISIHALREEGDGPPVKPRNLLTSFLSTPSARRATTSRA